MDAAPWAWLLLGNDISVIKGKLQRSSSGKGAQARSGLCKWAQQAGLPQRQPGLHRKLTDTDRLGRVCQPTRQGLLPTSCLKMWPAFAALGWRQPWHLWAAWTSQSEQQLKKGRKRGGLAVVERSAVQLCKYKSILLTHLIINGVCLIVSLGWLLVLSCL